MKLRLLALAALLLIGAHPSAFAAAPGVYSGTLSANTAGTEAFVTLPEGLAMYSAIGALGGGTLTIEMVDDAANLQTVVTAITTPGVGKIELGGCTNVRFKLTGAAGPSIRWMITPMHQFQANVAAPAACEKYRPAGQ